MGKKMKKTDGFKSYPMLGVAVAVAIFMTGCASAPTIPAPTEQMALSHAAINSANSAGGSEYAPVQLKSAMDKMDGAERAMGTKNYDLARQLAEEAQVDAQLAAAAARAGKAQKAADALRESDRVLHKELDRSAK
jgi:phage tail tube protein FII